MNELLKYPEYFRLAFSTKKIREVPARLKILKKKKEAAIFPI